MTSATNKPSWRGKSYQPTPKSASLGKRRWIATLLLCAMSIALGLIFWQWFVYRYPQTHIFAVVVNQGQKPNGQLDNLSIPPLRFTSAFPKALLGLTAKNFHLREEISLELKKLEERLVSISRQSQRQDSLVCSIQAQCMTIAGEPYLIDADFSLQDESLGPTSESTGGIALADILKLFVVFPGTVVIALDAGDVVADVTARCDQNDFLLKLQEIVKEIKNDRLWVLTSHSPGEISQDDLVSRERLFGRALAEAISGSVRVANSEEFLIQWSHDRFLTLDELANYVYRRVQADSGKTQSPWLIRSGEGLVRSDRSGWPDAKKVNLAKLDKAGRIQGLATPKSINSDDKSTAEKTALPLKAGSGPSTQDSVPPDSWVQNWQTFEKSWNRRTNAGAYAWTLAECSPLVYRQMRGQLIDAELRSRAGMRDSNSWTFSPAVEPNPADLQRLRELFDSNASQKRWEAAELLEKQSQAQFLQQVCQASLHVSEIRQLTKRLNALGEKSSPFLNGLVNSFQNRTAPGELRTALKSTLAELHRALDSLVNETIDNPKPAVLESLLLCGSLTSEQREKVLNKKRSQRLLDEEYPTSIPEFPPSWSKSPETLVSTIPFSLPRKTWSGQDAKNLDNAIEIIVQQSLQDDRLIARTDQTLSVNSRLASIPDPPERKKGWWHDWLQKGESISQPFRLEQKQSVLLSLKLDPFPKPSEVRIQCGPFPDGLTGLKLDGVRIDTANPTFIRKWAEIEQNGNQIVVELETREIDRPNTDPIILKISGVNGPTNEPLSLRLRLAIKDRIELNVTRLIRRDGKEEWMPEEASIKGHVFRLHPFVGHETRFSFEAINRGEKPRTIQADLYPLPTRIGVPGLLVSNDRYILSDFNEDAIIRQAKKTPAIATLKSIELKPQLATKIVLLPPAAAATEPIKPMNPQVGPDVSAGMLLIFSDASDSTLLESFLFEYDPSNPSEYIEAYVEVEANEQMRRVSVVTKFRDSNEDGMPDLAPTDSQIIDVGIFREPWMGVSPKGEFNGKIDPTRKLPPKLSLQVPLDATLEFETFLGVNIGGFPRALSKTISLRDYQKQPLESYKGNKPRASLQSVSDGTKTYWSVLPIEQKPDADFPLGPNSPAIFKQPKQVEMEIALDWVSDMSNGQMQSAILQLGDTEKLIFGDRNWVFEATKMNEDGLTLAAKASDHSVTVDSSGMQNQSLPLQTIISEKESVPVEVVFDSQLPEITGVKLLKNRVFIGEETRVEFEIQEHGLSGIRRFEILVLNSLNEEKVKLPDVLKQNATERDSRSIDRVLPIGKLEKGSYKVLVTAFDLAGNGPAKSNPIPLTILEKTAPIAPANDKTIPSVFGSIRGKVRFANGGEPSEAKVTLDSNGKSDQFPNGNFTFTEVPLGKYKLTAEFPYQSSTWVGEATGVFKTESDFQKEIVIKCKKAL